MTTPPDESTELGAVPTVRDPAGNPIAWQTGGASYYYVTDRQNSVLLLTDSGQNKVAEYLVDYRWSALWSWSRLLA